MELPKIAIVGGGPSGLTLARLLQNAEVPCTVFELDHSRSARNTDLQGSLDLHTGSGQQALKEAGLLEKFQELSRPEGQLFKMVDTKSLLPRIVIPPPPPGEPNKPEIMRTDLREMLLDSLHPESIKWGKKLKEVKMDDDSIYDLYFQDGSVDNGFDLVIGADGAWSKVRPLVSSEVPYYSGVSWALFQTPAKDIRQDLNELIGEGAVMASRERRSIWAQRLSDGDIYVALSMRVPSNWVDQVDIDFSDGDNARQRLAQDYLDEENWSKTLRQAVLGSKGPVIARPYWQLPIGWKWHHRSGVTLLGDAAHVMTPFAGVGVNTAMEDSLELAREIIKRKHDGKRAIVEDAAKAYEETMFVRAAKASALTQGNLLRVFGDSPAPEQFVMI